MELDPKCGTGIPALGRFQEPLERLGLAHFHEHMLFLGADPPIFRPFMAAHVTAGTEKYPKEDEYSLAAENPLVLQTPPPVAPGGPRTLGQPGPGRYLSEHGGDSNAPGSHRNGSLAAMFVLGWQLCAPEVHHVRIYHLLLQGPSVLMVAW